MMTDPAVVTINPTSIVSIMWIAAVALLAPTIVFLLGNRIPGVVFLLILGAVIGPEGLGLAQPDESIALLSELGLGMLFLLAGWEIRPEWIRGRQGASASITWVVGAALAFISALVLFGSDQPMQAVVVAIAVSSTALGTLLPGLKATGELDSPVGRGVMVHGAIGELGPICAMALLLSTRATWASLLILLVFMAVACIVAFVPRTVSTLVPWVERAVREGAGQTTQIALRAVLVLLTVLMALATVFGLDVVLGAFAAGIILRAVVPQRARRVMEARLNVLGYSLLIPVFFVVSGMSIDVSALRHAPLLVLLGCLLILVARGLPIFLTERFINTGSGIRDTRHQLQLSLYAATGLPIIVAVTELALARQLIDDPLAALLVCSGAATVLLFPIVASMAQHYAVSNSAGFRITQEQDPE